MDIVLPDLTEDEILVKIAHRAALLHKASKIEVDDINQKFSQYLDGRILTKRMIDLLAAADRDGVGLEVRQNIANIIKDQFVYTPAQETIDEVQAIKDQAHTIIPEAIRSQKWSPDTCGCKLNVVIDTSNPDNPQQTFFVTKGPEHAHLELDALHDVVFAESNLKNNFQRIIHLNIPNGKDIEYKWSFDANRKLVVDMKSLDQLTADAIKALANDPKFGGNITVETAADVVDPIDPVTP